VDGRARAAGAPLPGPPPQTAWGRENGRTCRSTIEVLPFLPRSGGEGPVERGPVGRQFKASRRVSISAAPVEGHRESCRNASPLSQDAVGCVRSALKFSPPRSFLTERGRGREHSADAASQRFAVFRRNKTRTAASATVRVSSVIGARSSASSKDHQRTFVPSYFRTFSRTPALPHSRTPLRDSASSSPSAPARCPAGR
jgi:hypothetical protein